MEPAISILQKHPVMAAAGLAAACTLGSLAAGCRPHHEGPALAEGPVLRSEPPAKLPEPHIPARAAGAMSGSAFMDSISDLEPEQREQAIYLELSSGNLPDFLRRLVPIRLAHPSGQGPAIVVHVMPDYLAIGSDDDYVHIAMNLYTATSLAREWGYILPTSRIVDAVFEQAGLRLTPSPLPPSREMTTSAYFLRHEEIVLAQLSLARPGQLIAGHKKDIVLSDKLNRRPRRIVIYGWHQPSGLPIQPLSPVHSARYADYSHGVRLVSSLAWLNGEQRSIQEVLAAFDTAPLLSDDGQIDNVQTLMSPTPPPETDAPLPTAPAKRGRPAASVHR